MFIWDCTGARALLPACVARSAFALALVVPLTAPRAETDCASLDIGLASTSDFSKIKCNSDSSTGGGLSQTEEGIDATSAATLFVVRHATAGVRTYFMRTNTRHIIDAVSAFAKIE